MSGGDKLTSLRRCDVNYRRKSFIAHSSRDGNLNSSNAKRTEND